VHHTLCEVKSLRLRRSLPDHVERPLDHSTWSADNVDNSRGRYRPAKPASLPGRTGGGRHLHTTGSLAFRLAARSSFLESVHRTSMRTAATNLRRAAGTRHASCESDRARGPHRKAPSVTRVHYEVSGRLAVGSWSGLPVRRQLQLSDPTDVPVASHPIERALLGFQVAIEEVGRRRYQGVVRGTSGCDGQRRGVADAE
jgi:hypothetical protein